MIYQLFFTDLWSVIRNHRQVDAREAIEQDLEKLGITAIITWVKENNKHDCKIVFKTQEDMNLFKVGARIQKLTSMWPQLIVDGEIYRVI